MSNLKTSSTKKIETLNNIRYPLSIYANTTLLNEPWINFSLFISAIVWLGSWNNSREVRWSNIVHAHKNYKIPKLNKRELCRRHQYGIPNSNLARKFILRRSLRSWCFSYSLFIHGKSETVFLVFNLPAAVEMCCISNSLSSTVYLFLS